MLTTSTEYGQNITSQLRPLTEAQKAQPSNRGNGVFGSGLEGLGIFVKTGYKNK